MLDANSETAGINKKHKLDAHDHVDRFPQHNAKLERKKKDELQYNIIYMN